MQISSLILATSILSLSGASIIPVMRNPAQVATATTLLNAYARRASADIDAVLEPQNFADVQVDRRKAFGEPL
ncbi:hypothetical protein ANO14919_006280 [Xylariales sp. No.14919]|nr:hypothetical protein ANO14919_006280 [Xylariales sp. No.14919]